MQMYSCYFLIVIGLYLTRDDSRRLSVCWRRIWRVPIIMHWNLWFRKYNQVCYDTEQNSSYILFTFLFDFFSVQWVQFRLREVRNRHVRKPSSWLTESLWFTPFMTNVCSGTWGLSSPSKAGKLLSRVCTS